MVDLPCVITAMLADDMHFGICPGGEGGGGSRVGTALSSTLWCYETLTQNLLLGKQEHQHIPQSCGIARVQHTSLVRMVACFLSCHLFIIYASIPYKTQ